MHIPRLYLDIDLSAGTDIELPQAKSHHIAHVLRMRVGQTLKLFNGSRHEYEARISVMTKKVVHVQIGRAIAVDNESPLKISLCLAISRGPHMDIGIQKAVELGVDNIVPIISEYSNVKLQNSRIENKMAHWQNIIISATEQCGRVQLADLQYPVSFIEWLSQDQHTTRCILHPASKQGLSTVNKTNDMSLLIGPEGGFSESEINQALSKDYLPISLGPRILRTETAVISAVSLVQQLWGDLN